MFDIILYSVYGNNILTNSIEKFECIKFKFKLSYWLSCFNLNIFTASDAIIRQHKVACLRITSLLICKDSLWAGTSAGVVLTLPLPNITPITTSIPNQIEPHCLDCGHTGHVRFLTSVEVVEENQLPVRG